MKHADKTQPPSLGHSDQKRAPLKRPGLLHGRLFGKFFISFLGMAALTIALLWLIQAGLMRDTYLNTRIERVRRAVERAAAGGEIDLALLGEETSASILVIPADGDAGDLLMGAGGYGPGNAMMGAMAQMPMMGSARRQIQNMIDRGDFTNPRIFTASNSTVRYALIGQRLENGGSVFAVFSLADVDAAAELLRGQLAWISLALFFVAMLLAFILSFTLSQPILAATKVARNLAAGELDVRLPTTGHDEITELSAALNELGQQLQITEKLRRELIANVSHELKSPLTVIRGYAETVRDVTWLDEKRREEQLTLIADEASRLTSVVGDILDYSRLQAGERPAAPAVFPVVPAVDQVCRRYSLMAQQLTLNLKQDNVLDDQTRIRFDPGQFDQVMTNLVANALDHADPKSTVLVRSARLSDQDDQLTGGPLIRIEVENTGDTIPPEELPRIWERYHRADQVRDDQRLGTGLGLAIVRSILRQHQVSFGVSSANGRTVFWFTAPLA